MVNRFRVALRRRISRSAGVLAVLASAAFLTACGITVPADPNGTLEAVTGDVLRVGTSPDGDLVQISDGTPKGSVVELVDAFAATIRADPEWTVASEESLVGMLEAGELDLIAGGITADTPWVERAGVSRGYTDISGADGREIVMLVPLGENAFLSRLEGFLDEEVGG
jgi:ABC-type amino acid transport substrate-binding protein